MNKIFPDTLEFEITCDVIVASTRNHERDNPLALALTERIGTRYHVRSSNNGSQLLAIPSDDRDPRLAAGEDAPNYILDGVAVNFLNLFDQGSQEIVNYHNTWFTASRQDLAKIIRGRIRSCFW